VVGEDPAAPGQLAEPGAQLVEGDRERPGEMAGGILLRRPDVEERGAGVGGAVEAGLDVGLGVLAAEHAAGDEPRLVDRVLRRAELRRVAQLGLFEVEDGHARLQRDRDHVDPLVDANAADGLRAEQLAGRRVEQHLERQLLGARVVTGVVGGMDVDLAERAPRAPERLLRRPGAGGDLVEDADDRRSLRAPVADRRQRLGAEDGGGRDPPLAVGRTGQRHLRRPATDEVADRDRVADGIDPRIARAHPLVDTDPPARSDVEPGRDGQRAFRADADAECHQVGSELGGRREARRPPPRASGSKPVADVPRWSATPRARSVATSGVVISRSSGGRT
jgi:hypothetical protein